MCDRPKKSQTSPDTAYKSSLFAWNITLAQLEMDKMAALMVGIKIREMGIDSIHSRFQCHFVYFRT